MAGGGGEGAAPPVQTNRALPTRAVGGAQAKVPELEKRGLVPRGRGAAGLKSFQEKRSTNPALSGGPN